MRRRARDAPRHERLARAAARRAAARLQRRRSSRSTFERGPRDPAPLARARAARLSAGARGRSRPGRHRLRAARPSIGFRIADVRGLAAADAVVAAAVAQLGWPYVWGGESRAEGGFDCSGLVDYALAAAGRPVGRLDGRRPPATRAAARGALPAAGGRPALRRHAGAPCRPRRRARAGGRGAAPRSARARRADRRRRVDGRRPDRAGRRGHAHGEQRAGRAGLRAGGASSAALARRARRAGAAGTARGAARGRERLRRLGPLARRRHGHCAVHARNMGRHVEPAAVAEPVRARAGDRRTGAPDAPPAGSRRR